MVFIFLGLGLTGEGQQMFAGLDYAFKNHLSVGKNGYFPTDSTAWLEIGAINTNKGFLPPRSDTSYIPKKAGSFMYEITANQFYYSDGKWWYPLSNVTGTFIKNGTSSQSANFNISGAGTIGGFVSVGGNLLIGKNSQTDSSYRLDVNGNARVNEIVVNTTGADFVFSGSYSPLSIDSLKAFIDQYHHLPEVPSAEQMQKTGLNLGNTQILLLQKVEELTLYIIRQNQQIRELQKQITSMADQIRVLNGNGFSQIK